MGYPTEAEVAKQFAIANEIPTRVLLVNNESRSTKQNLLCAKELMDHKGIRTAFLVSDPLHMKQAIAIAMDLGLRTQPIPTVSNRIRSWRTWSKFLWRETWLYIEYLLFYIQEGKFTEDVETA